MQDVDFLNNKSVGVWSGLIWIFPFFVILVFFSISIIRYYSDIVELKSQYESLSLNKDESDYSDSSSGESNRQYNENLYFTNLFDYFSNVDGRYVTIKVIAIEKPPSVKVSGEAKDMESLSIFNNELAKSDLFEGFSDYRLSVYHSQLEKNGIRWTIEWLK